jgi:hypothetical protein
MENSKVSTIFFFSFALVPVVTSFAPPRVDPVRDGLPLCFHLCRFFQFDVVVWDHDEWNIPLIEILSLSVIII